MATFKKSRPLQIVLAVLVMGSLLPVLLFSSWLVVESAAGSRTKVIGDLALQVDSLRSDLDRQLITLQQSMYILGASEALATGNLARFHEQAIQVADRSGLSITLADSTGQLLVATRLPLGTNLPVAGSIDVIKKAISSGRPAVSNLLKITFTGEFAVTMAIPVKVAGRDLAMTMDVTNAVNAIVSQEHIAEGAFVTVLDGVGRKIARFPEVKEAIGEKASANALEKIAAAEHGNFTGTTRFGKEDLNSFAHLTAAPWTINIGIPREVLFAPLLASLSLLMLVAGASLLAALAIAGLIGMRVTEPIGLLSEMAWRLSRGEAVLHSAPSGIREVDAATSSLAEACKMLQARTAERQEAFAELREQMVDRAQLQAQLVQSQRLEAVGLLTGGVAHDFNNILGAIVGSMELAIDQVPENAAVAAVLEEGIAAAMFGSNLTRRLLAFARQQPLEPSQFDLNEVVNGLANMLERTLGGQVSVKVVLEPELWLAHADPSQIGDAMLNLSINARDAMPEGGEVRIETGNTTLDAFGAAKALDVAPGDYVTLAVTDTGTGMSEEVIARACEPFFTTKDAGKGSGLGLSMIYGFARQSGGNVKIESVCGTGTTVRLYLPRASVATGNPAKVVAPIPERLKCSETILVVDDFASMRTLSFRLLTSMGYQVLEAENAHQALAILDSEVKIDLLFTDIVMPGGLSGQALADEMHKRGRMLPVLFTSGYARSDFEVDDALVSNLLSKPYSKQELATRIRQTLDAW